MNERTYKARREALMAQMGEGLAVIGSAPQKVRTNDTEYPYRQNSDFYYLTGFEEDNAVLVLVKRQDATKVILFVQPKDEKMELWTGKRLGTEAAAKRFEVDATEPVTEIAAKLPDLMANLPTLYVDLYDGGRWRDEAQRSAEALRHKRETKRPVKHFIDVAQLIRGLRLMKDDEEVALIRAGLAITGAAHHHAMRVCAPGMMEYALQAEYEYFFKKNGAYSDAYTTIIAGGDHANTLHYINNDDVLTSGDLVLIDAGCEYRYYATDITRTFPVSGRFSAAQRTLYEAVLDVQLRIIDMIGPGVFKSELQKASEQMLCEKLVELGILQGEIETLIAAKIHKKYYPHGIGHWLGIDVHDPAPYFDDNGDEIPMAPGMIITIEPGLYLPRGDTDVPEAYRGMGIRIEDDILVTAQGNENLSAAVAKSVEAIEKVCAGGKA